MLTNTSNINQSVTTTPTSTPSIPVPVPTPLAPVVTPTNPDADNDTLSTFEENLYGTDVKLYDTDGDGYGDGAELLSGYNPLLKNASLASSGLFQTYANSGYTVSRPTTWSGRTQDGDNQVSFTASTGKSVSITKATNLKKLSLVAWITEQFPSTDVSSFTQVTINGALGLRHSNNLSYYLYESHLT